MFACTLLLQFVWCMHVSCIDSDVHSCFELWSALSQSSWIRRYISVTHYYYYYYYSLLLFSLSLFFSFFLFFFFSSSFFVSSFFLVLFWLLFVCSVVVVCCWGLGAVCIRPFPAWPFSALLEWNFRLSCTFFNLVLQRNFPCVLNSTTSPLRPSPPPARFLWPLSGVLMKRTWKTHGQMGAGRECTLTR